MKIKIRNFRFNNTSLIDLAFLSILPVFFLFFHLFSQRVNLFFGDNLIIFANAFNIINIISEGVVPLRDPYLFLDLVGGSNASMLYWPYSVLYLISGIFFADKLELIRHIWSMLLFAHLFLPGLSAYFFLKYLRFSRYATILGAILYGWNAYTFTMGGIYDGPIRFAHMAAIPAIWLVGLYSFDLKKMHLNILGGILAGWAILAGGLQPVIYTIPFFFIYVLVRRYLLREGFSIRDLLGIFAPVLFFSLGMFITASPAIVAGQRILPYLSRSFLGSSSPEFFNFPEFWLGLIEPFYQWSRDSLYPWESIRYFGFLGTVFFLIGFLIYLRNSRVKPDLLGLAMAFMLVVTGTLVVTHSHLPELLLKLLMFSGGFTRYPFRIYPVVMFAVSFFAAKGLDFFLTSSDKNRGAIKIFILLAGNVFILTKYLIDDSVVETFFPFFTGFFFILGSVIACMMIKPQTKAVWLLLFLFMGDLGSVGYTWCDNVHRLHKFLYRDMYKQSFLREEDSDWVKDLPERDLPYRVKILKAGEPVIFRGTGYLYHRLRNPFGYDGSLGLFRMSRLRRLVSKSNYTHPVLGLMGVRVIHATTRMTPFEKPNINIKTNPNASPLIWFARDLKLFDTDENLFDEVSKRVRPFGKTVFLSEDDIREDIDLLRSLSEKKYPFRGRFEATELSYGINEIKFRINNDQAALCVLSEPWVPNWQAYVNDSKVPIYRAFGFLQAIRIPQGENEVVFRYEFPLWIIWGSYLFQFICCVYFGGKFISKRKSRFK